jgi:N,N'-diacetyllegionaminate synthase
MRIGGLDIDRRVALVAEIGNNHEGDAAVAREMVIAAAAAGADAVKFQTFRAERYVSPSDERRFVQLKRFELADDDVVALAAQARGAGIAFMSTPFDIPSVELLEPLVDALKVASGDLDFFPLLRRVAATDRPLVLSTGVSDMARINRALDEVRAIRGGLADVAVLHCTSAYPAPAADARLRAIPWLAERLPCPVGFSDHTLGLDAAPLAVALGARIVEKHFTLEGIESDFRDHELSLTPPQMAELARRIRSAEEMLGTPGKELLDVERGVADAVRRSIAAGRDLPAGHVVAEADLAWLRPGGGVAPGREWTLVGRTLRRPVRQGERITHADLA